MVDQYHLEAVNERTGKRVRLTSHPMTHDKVMTLKSKFNVHKDVRIQVEVSECTQSSECGRTALGE